MLPLGADTPRDPEPPAAEEPPRRLLYPEERTPPEATPTFRADAERPVDPAGASSR